MTNQRFKKVGTVANELGYHPDTIRKWCQQGKIAAIQKGKDSHWRIYADYKQRWLDKQNIALLKKHGLPEVEIEGGK